MREVGKVVKPGIQEPVHPWKVHPKVPVDEHVAKTGDAPEPENELRGQDAELAEDVDGARVIRSIASRACRQVRGDVERIDPAPPSSARQGRPRAPRTDGRRDVADAGRLRPGRAGAAG